MKSSRCGGINTIKIPVLVYDMEEIFISKNKKCTQQIMEEFVYLIGIVYPFGELNIMGIYTDKKMLIKAYDKLIKEDVRCRELKYPEMPEIYKIPLNKFLGEVLEWTKIEDKHFFSGENIESVSIDEIRTHIRIASFCGVNVYCDLAFAKGAYIDLEYVGGGEEDYCWIRMNIEDGSFDTTYKYLQSTLKCWYEENKSYLMGIYQTRKIVDIPKWED